MGIEKLHQGRLLGVVGVLALLLLAGSISPSGSRAEIPQPISCEALDDIANEWIDAAAYTWLPTRYVAWNRKVRVEWQRDSAIGEVPDSVSNVRVRFESADPNRPVSWPRNVALSGRYGVTSVRFAKGDGPGRVSVSWDQTYKRITVEENDSWVQYPDITCTFTESRVLEPVRGAKPNLHWDFRSIGISGSEQLRIGYYSRDFCRPKKWRQQVAGGDVILRIKGPATNFRSNIGGLCSGWNQRERSTRFLNIAPQFDFVAINPKSKREGSRVFRISAQIAGQKLLRARVRFETTHVPYTEIWEGSDAFINVCINQTVPIYSSGGRLYCAVGGKGYTDFRVLSWKPFGGR